MKILVCIKQVPATTTVDIDPETKNLKRAGVEAKINPFDLYALETALQIKKENSAQVTAMTMGPPQACEALQETFMLGVDDAFLLSDRRFAGADVLATAFTLAQGIKADGMPDMIICGKQTTDGDTGQVGPELAEFLDVPHLANVLRLVSIEKDYLTAEIDLPDSVQLVKIPFPCLITVEKGIFQPRLPSFKLKLATQHKKVRVLSLDDMPATDLGQYGLDGSPTQVKRIFPPDDQTDHELWEGNSDYLAQKIFEKLCELKVL